MSTVAQVAQIVRPFLDRYPDFALVGRSVVMKPIRHLMRSFFIDRTSGKGYIQTSWNVSAMFGPSPRHVVTTGARMVAGVGFVDNPDTQVRLLAAMEQVASDIFHDSSIDALPALAWRAEPVFGPGALIQAMPLLARGRFSDAVPYVQQTLTRVSDAIEERKRSLGTHRSLRGQLAKMEAHALERMLPMQAGLKTLLDRLNGGDPRAVAALLHEWEAAAVKAEKVEHLWEPSPFPFEVSGNSSELGVGD